MNTVSGPELGPSEKMLVSLESPVFGALYRVAIGFAILPALAFFAGRRPEWVLLPVFVGVLLLQRAIPAVLRKALRFSEGARGIWAERRQLAKRHDSYQWRKLFWIGVGLAGEALISGEWQLWSRQIVIGMCLAGGGMGIARWWMVSRKINQPRRVGV